MGVNYVRPLSDEEVNQFYDKVDDWWDSLRNSDKAMIYENYEKIIRQRYCAHDKVLGNTICVSCHLKLKD